MEKGLYDNEMKKNDIFFFFSEIGKKEEKDACMITVTVKCTRTKSIMIKSTLKKKKGRKKSGFFSFSVSFFFSLFHFLFLSFLSLF